MLSRRYFLVSSGAVLLASAAETQGLPLAVASPLCICVIIEPDLSELRVIAAGQHVAEIRIEIDDGEYLARLAEALDTRRPHAIVGLTRDSDFTVISQFAYERGYVRTNHDRYIDTAEGLLGTKARSCTVRDPCPRVAWAFREMSGT